MSQLFLILALAASTFSKSEFFDTLSSGSQTEIENLEKKLSAEKQGIDQQAYLGTIKMKLSEFGKTPGDKLKEFKAGRTLLELSIKEEQKNAEFRFLRLIIQENAPKMLKYNTDISADAAFIKANYDKLAKDVKLAVSNYSKSSKNLNL